MKFYPNENLERRIRLLKLISKISSFLMEKDFFYIITHAYPDGDALGCAFGLCRALQKSGKKAKVIYSKKIPEKFEFLEKFVSQQEFKNQCVISVDLAEPSLIEPELMVYGDKIDVCIDHHKVNKVPANLSCVDSSAAACGEIIYQILSFIGCEIDKEIATCLYTGISTDTGCFCYSNTSANSHYISAKLIECGAPISLINENLFIVKSPLKIEVEKLVQKNLKYFFNGKCAITYVSLENMSLLGITDDELDGIASMPIRVQGVDIGITIREKQSGECKVSVRTSKNVDAGDFCLLFGGGGHQRAAGFSLKCSVEESIQKILSKISCELGWRE